MTGFESFSIPNDSLFYEYGGKEYNPSFNPNMVTEQATGNPMNLMDQMSIDGSNTNSSLMQDLGGLGGIGQLLVGIGNLWSSYNAGEVAKKSLKFQKNAYRTNLANMVKNYNSNLEDRIKSRFVTENKTEDQANKLISERRL